MKYIVFLIFIFLMVSCKPKYTIDGVWDSENGLLKICFKEDNFEVWEKISIRILHFKEMHTINFKGKYQIIDEKLFFKNVLFNSNESGVEHIKFKKSGKKIKIYKDKLIISGIIFKK